MSAPKPIHRRGATMSYYSEMRKARKMIDTTFADILEHRQEIDYSKMCYQLGLQYELGDKIIEKLIHNAIKQYDLVLDKNIIKCVEE
jgi:predicted transcriptional regulator